MRRRFRDLWQSSNPGKDPAGNSTGSQKSRRRDGTLRHPRREFLVIGLGRFGTSVAKALLQEGHDVLAIDVDFRRVQELSKELPNIVQIDATNMDALREIGAEYYDTGVVCIGYDFESNLLATVLLQKLGVRRVITKAGTRTQREILLQVGATEVILPEHEAGTRLAHRISTTNFVDYLPLGTEGGVVEMQAPKHLHNRTLADADLVNAYGLAVLALKRNGEFTFNPSGDIVIQEGDELLVLGKMHDAERLSG
jgi:trk system potassium uptake protein